MTFTRLKHMAMMSLLRSDAKRTKYFRKHKVFANIGDNVHIQSRFIPLYSELISFHNNIIVGRGVEFVTHDVIHAVLNRMDRGIYSDHRFKESIGCIEIEDNCFIGANTIILGGVRIRKNCIIAAGSVVTKDCESDSLYAGVPARRICSLDDYMKKRIDLEQKGLAATTSHNQQLTDEEIAMAWEIFNKQHNAAQ